MENNGIFMQTLKYFSVYISYTMSERVYRLKDVDMEIVHAPNYLAARVGGKEIVLFAKE